MEIKKNKVELPFYIKLVDRSFNNKLIVDIIHLPKENSFELEINSYYRYFLFKNRVILFDESGVNLTEETAVGAGSPKYFEPYIFTGTSDNPYIVEMKELIILGYEKNNYYLSIGLRNYELEFDKIYILIVTTNDEKSNEIVFKFKNPNFIQRIYINFQFHWEIESFALRYKYRVYKSKLLKCLFEK